MARVHPTTIISNWNHRVPGLQQASDEFYGSVERLLGEEHLDDITIERVNIAEGGLFSAKRQYLQLRRKDHVFHICAAPFGNGFFISWWLGHVERGFFAWLASIPVIGLPIRALIKPATYYKIDTALMFQSVTHAAVLAALDGIVDAKGLRALSDVDRKPVMRDFFSRK